jgi:hypothetical protein
LGAAEFFAHKYRNIETLPSMSIKGTNTGGNKMELLIPLGVFVVWIVLQAMVLPRLGVKT